jgi:hypothetical protein
MTNRSVVSLKLILLLFLFTITLSTIPLFANGNDTLVQSFSTILNGDVASFGIGLRDTGTGDIVVSGLPVTSTVSVAFLYWATLGSNNTYTNPTLNGTPVNGSVVGTTHDTCWGVTHNFVYRADVTSLVTGDGTYTLAGLPNNFNPDNSQGASLVIVYSDPSLPLRRIIINDGAVSLDGVPTYTDTIKGFVGDSPLTNAHVTYIVGDGQTFQDGDILFNGTTIDTDAFSGSDGPLWDTLTYDVTALNPTDPSASNMTTPDDCLLWAATVFSITTVPIVCDFQDLFADGVFDWIEVKPSWIETNNNLEGTPTGRKAVVTAPATLIPCDLCTITTNVAVSTDVDSKAWILTHRIDKKTQVEILIKAGTDKISVKIKQNGALIAKAKGTFVFDPNVFYNVVASYNGTHYRVVVNGAEVALIPITGLQQGTAGYQIKNATMFVADICVD